VAFLGFADHFLTDSGALEIGVFGSFCLSLLDAAITSLPTSDFYIKFRPDDKFCPTKGTQ
jgi:hypothetical protein